MTDFIRVYENALIKNFDNFITLFEQSAHLKQGMTSGIDLAKKDSHDLYLSNHPEYAEQLKHIQQVTAGASLNTLKSTFS